MTQFTASEMRAEAHRHANEVEDMLNAFADLLEAREKAVPVAEMTEGGLTWYQQFSPQRNAGTKFYTHAATSDADEVIRIHPDVAKAQAIPFDVNDGRPTKSAQAQPPAASVTDGLVDALRHQRQIDEDGAEVGVSRQAVDEAANILAMLAAQESRNG